MENKNIIEESIRIADSIAKKIAFWKKLFIYTLITLFIIIILFLAYIYNSKQYKQIGDYKNEIKNIIKKRREFISPRLF